MSGGSAALLVVKACFGSLLPITAPDCFEAAVPGMHRKVRGVCVENKNGRFV